MAATYIPIASTTLSSSAASVTFSSIPQTYTDLVLRVSIRDDGAGTNTASQVTLNGSSSSVYSRTVLRGDGSAASSFRGSNETSWTLLQNGGGTTSNTFSNTELYIPNYTSSASKVGGATAVQENNSSTANIFGIAFLAGITSAVTSITFTHLSANYVSGSTFHLYGISNA